MTELFEKITETMNSFIEVLHKCIAQVRFLCILNDLRVGDDSVCLNQ